IWIDPDTGRYAVLLTNRVHPSRAGDGITAVRRAFHDEAAAPARADRSAQRSP
ncbi:esterase, partial [Streptomyces sp. NPDC004629]